MTVEDLRDYCLSLPGVTEKMPWIGHKVYSSGLCFYICGKWFCFCDVDNFDFINIKLPPAMERSFGLNMMLFDRVGI